MSLETILGRIRDAFDRLNRIERRQGAVAPVPAPRLRRQHGSVSADKPILDKDGFADEALPWMDAVHRFALRLTRGDGDRAADLVQETFLKAYRSWDSFQRGSHCRSWLFTICKNTHLHIMGMAATRHEISETQLEVDVDSLAVQDVHDYAQHQNANRSVFDDTLDERVVAAIDALPDDYRDALVLSDLADLNYGEISTVLDIPIGTVKSRLFRARRQLQKSLIDYAAEAGFTLGRSA
jgi:RNA polymerase sigma-70 factor (ECF subfamily)